MAMAFSRIRQNYRATQKRALSAFDAAAPIDAEGERVIAAAIADNRLMRDELAKMTPQQRAEASRRLRAKLASGRRGGPAAARGRTPARSRPSSRAYSAFDASPSRAAREAVPARRAMQNAMGEKGARKTGRALSIARTARGNKPAPRPRPMAATSAKLDKITAGAFNIAAAKQVAKAGGGRAIAMLKDDIKTKAVDVVADHMETVAREAGIDYAAAKAVYDGQVGVDSPQKIAVRTDPVAVQAMRAVNKVSGEALDKTLAARRQSPVGKADADPVNPPPAIDPKVVLAAVAVAVLLLVRG